MLNLFKMLSLLDWITPAAGIIEDLVNESDSWTFYVPYDDAMAAGWNPAAIIDLITIAGFVTWGGQYTFPQNDYMFKVARSDAAAVEYTLIRHGVPLDARYIGGYGQPAAEMNSAADFAPAGLTVIGPSGPARVAGWLLRKVFG